MNKDIISEALNYIDDSLLEETDRLRTAPRSKKIRNIGWAKYASLVAAAAVVLVVGSVAIGNLGGAKRQSMKAESTNQMMAADSTERVEMKYYLADNKTVEPSFGKDTITSMAPPTMAPGNAVFDGAYSSDSADNGFLFGKAEDTVEEASGVQDYNNTVSDIEFTVGAISNNAIFEQGTIDCNIVEANPDVVKVLFVNKTEKSVFTGSDYELEKKDGEVWYSCALANNAAFDAVAYTLEAGAEREFTFDLYNTYGPLEKGQYRIVQTFSAGDLISSYYDVITTAVEFEIK